MERKSPQITNVVKNVGEKKGSLEPYWWECKLMLPL